MELRSVSDRHLEGRWDVSDGSQVFVVVSKHPDPPGVRVFSVGSRSGSLEQDESRCWRWCTGDGEILFLCGVDALPDDGCGRS